MILMSFFSLFLSFLKKTYVFLAWNSYKVLYFELYRCWILKCQMLSEAKKITPSKKKSWKFSDVNVTYFLHFSSRHIAVSLMWPNAMGRWNPAWHLFFDRIKQKKKLQGKNIFTYFILFIFIHQFRSILYISVWERHAFTPTLSLDLYSPALDVTVGRFALSFALHLQYISLENLCLVVRYITKIVKKGRQYNHSIRKWVKDANCKFLWRKRKNTFVLAM